MATIKLEPWTSIGPDEWGASRDVIQNAHHRPHASPLSGFLGGQLEGGREVRALEDDWTDEFNARFAVSVNSATSGILIALKACGVERDDEVIVSPYSMSAGVACVLWCGGIPVFADIGDEYCLDLEAATKAITKNTKAILVTNLFGYAAAWGQLASRCRVIEDNAQAPYGATHRGTRGAGHRCSDIKVDSFNVHKPMQAGEGGICWTDVEVLDRSMRLLRNHGEMAGGPPGLNLRMTEVTAAIAREQLRKGREVVAGRRELAHRLLLTLKGHGGIAVPSYDPNHAYYVLAVRVDARRRDAIIEGLNARGVPAHTYVKPLYTLPAFREYKTHCPFTEQVASEIVCLDMYAWDYTPEIMDQIAGIYKEVVDGA